MILVLSALEDRTVRAVLPELEALGASVLWFDPAEFPGASQVSLELDRRGFYRKLLHRGGRTIDLDEVSAVWVRRPRAVEAGPTVREEGRRRWAEDSARDAMQGLYELLDGLWMPARPRVTLAAMNKIWQLSLAAELGLKVPRTCITSSPDTFLEFREETEGELISKSVAASLLAKVDGERRAPFTSPVHRRHAVNAAAVRHAPAIFQAYVPKRLELRVTVVGDRVFPVAIDSQSSRLTRHDWRHYDNERTAYTPHALPPDVEGRCVELLRRLGLTYGAIDMVLTPAGDYVFLEINPNGQWEWVQELSGVPIARAIAEVLVGGLSRGREESARAAL